VAVKKTPREGTNLSEGGEMSRRGKGPKEGLEKERASTIRRFSGDLVFREKERAARMRRGKNQRSLSYQNGLENLLRRQEGIRRDSSAKGEKL